MAYECLKGAPPFSHGQIEFQIMNKQSEPLTEVSTTGSLPVGVNGLAACSTSIAASVMAGLAKKPEDRPATCAAVLERNDFSRNERKEAGEPRSVAALKGLAAAAALVLVAAGGIILYSQRQHQHTEARRSTRIIGYISTQAAKASNSGKTARTGPQRTSARRSLKIPATTSGGAIPWATSAWATPGWRATDLNRAFGLVQITLRPVVKVLMH